MDDDNGCLVAIAETVIDGDGLTRRSEKSKRDPDENVRTTGFLVSLPLSKRRKQKRIFDQVSPSFGSIFVSSVVGLR